MLNKKWIAGAVLGAFLGLTAIMGGSEAEASAITAELQPVRSDVVIVIDPFHDRWDRHPAPPPHRRWDRHPGPRHHHPAPPPHHGKHHPRPHHR